MFQCVSNPQMQDLLLAAAVAAEAAATATAAAFGIHFFPICELYSK